MKAARLTACTFAAVLAVTIAAIAKRKVRCRGSKQRGSTARLAAKKADHTDNVHPKVVSRYAKLPSGPDQVSLITWNLLSDSLALPKRYPWVVPGALEWQKRSQLIAAELQALSPDIIALQEVEGARWPEVCSWLPGWCGIIQDQGKGGDDGKKDAMLLGLLWKPHLQLVWSEHRSRALIAQLAMTDSQGNQQNIWVVNVHLEGSPYRPNDRVNQIRNALSKLEARQQAVGCTPATSNVIICGDFNSGRGESVWRLLHRGRLEGGSTESYLPHVEVTRVTISHPYALQDCYQAAGNPVPWTRKAPGVAATIDYCWASTHMQVAAVYDPLRGTRHPPHVWVPDTAPPSTRSRRIDAPPAITLEDEPSRSKAQRTHSMTSHTSHASSVVSKAHSTKTSHSGKSNNSTVQETSGCIAVMGGCGRQLAQSCNSDRAGLPNAFCPSDHLPLGVVVRLRVEPTNNGMDTQQTHLTNGAASMQQ